MSEQGQPVPQRIGDAERDRAAELLREHMAQGRLSAEEFDERVDAALKAKVASDLDPLFSDLPGPRPGQGVATTPGPHAPPWQAAAIGQAPPEPPRPAAEKLGRVCAQRASPVRCGPSSRSPHLRHPERAGSTSGG